MPDDWHPSTLPFVRTGQTWLAYVLLGYFSYLLNVLGPLMPFLRSELGLSYTLGSLHFTAFACGRVVTGLASDRLIERFGRQRVAWGGAGGTAAGTALLMLGRHPALTLAGTFVMGALGASIPVIIQAALADQHGALRGVAFTEANALASAVSALAPISVGFFARGYPGWRGALAVAVVAPLLLFAAFHRYSLTSTTQFRRGGPASARLPAAFWAYWMVLVLVVAAEFCIVYWATDFLEGAKGLARADAALSTSAFLGGMFVGRLAGSRILRRTQSVGVLLVSLAVALVGFTLQWQGNAIPVVEAGLVIAGLGIANLYPLGLSLAMEITSQQPDTASARASLAVAIAILGLPLLLGRLADHAGISRAYGLVAVLLGLAAIAVMAARGLAAVTGREHLAPAPVRDRLRSKL